MCAIASHVGIGEVGVRIFFLNCLPSEALVLTVTKITFTNTLLQLTPTNFDQVNSNSSVYLAVEIYLTSVIQVNPKQSGHKEYISHVF